MARAARYVYLALAWLFVVGVLVQVFFIGLALFGDRDTVALHVNFGWILHLVPLLILGAAALGRVGRRRILETAALAVVVFLVPIFATMRDVAVIAALHPVSAVIAFWLAVVVARSATSVVRQPDEAPVEASAPAPG